MAQDKDVKFALDFIPLGRHAPWYVALDKGYFKEEKLNVTILPTKGTADAVRCALHAAHETGPLARACSLHPRNLEAYAAANSAFAALSATPASGATYRPTTTIATSSGR